MMEKSKQCPLCQQPADFLALVPARSGSHVLCERCGEFVISRQLLMDLWQPDADERALLPYLSAHTRQEWEAGRRAEVGTDNWKELAQRHARTPVARKLARVLEWYGRHSRAGDRVVVKDWSLVAPLWD